MEASKVRKDLSDTLNRVAYGGERIVLRRHGRNVAALVSMTDLKMIEEIEDRIDIREAKKALKEGGRIPYEQFRKEIGLDKKK